MKKHLYPLIILLFATSAFNPSDAGDQHLNFKVNSTSGTAVLLRMNLYRVYPTRTVIQDGTLTQYGDNYSDKIDGYDARKMSIPGENVSLYRNDTDLVVERRQTIQSADTIFFRMWGMQQTSYKMEIVPSNLNTGFSAYLVDNYLHTIKVLDLSDTTEVTFSINSDASSVNPFRFQIIFSAMKKLTAIPFTFLSLGARYTNNLVQINWKTSNEMNLTNYLIERSANQKDYQPVASVTAMNSSSNDYEWTDENPLTESNFYRIKSVEVNGNTSYSQVVKVMSSKIQGSISIFPIPVNGNSMNLRLSNEETGVYKVLLYNSFGAVLLTRQFSCSAQNAEVKIPVDNTISKGVYYFEIIKPSGKKELMNIVF